MISVYHIWMNLWIYLSNNINASKNRNLIWVHCRKNNCYYVQLEIEFEQSAKELLLFSRANKAAAGSRRLKAKSSWGLRGKKSEEIMNCKCTTPL